MKNIKLLIDAKKASIKSLENEKALLQNNMAKPSDINNNAQRIETDNRAISLLNDTMELAEESGTTKASAEELVKNLIGELVEAKYEAESMQKQDYMADNSKVIPTLNKDLAILTSIIDDGINKSNIESTHNETSFNNSATSTSTTKQDSSNIMPDYTNLPDYNDPSDV